LTKHIMQAMWWKCTENGAFVYKCRLCIL